MPASSIAHFETGTRKPSFDSLRRLANALEMTTDYLLGRVDEPDLAQAGDPLFGTSASSRATTARSPRTSSRCLAERNARKRPRSREPRLHLKMARQTAEAFLKREGITSLPVDPFAIAASRDIVVEGKPERGRLGHAAPPRQRLRHRLRDAYPQPASSASASAMSSGTISSRPCRPGDQGRSPRFARRVRHHDPYELEADHFAAGLLMPEAPFRKEMDAHDPGLDALAPWPTSA